jgi:hypothetical protein
MTIKRRLGAWLIGLYVLALLGGITPLMDSDSAHAGAPITLSAYKGAILATPTMQPSTMRCKT